MKKTVTTYNSLTATSVIGLTPRYSDETPIYSLNDFGIFWQDAAQKQYMKTGIYVSAIISEAKVVYRVDSGSPVGGEHAVDVRADGNPVYSDELSESEYFKVWKDTFLTIVEEVAEKLNQTTVTIKFSDGELVYLTNH